MRFSKKNLGVQIMAVVLILVIAIPSIFFALAFNLFWFFLLMALIFVPVLFIERQRDRY